VYMRSLLIIYSFIVNLQLDCGMPFFSCLVLIGLCLKRVNDLLGSWRGQLEARHALQIWRLAPLCLMWCFWRVERKEF
jgi:hypothetical protein